MSKNYENMSNEEIKEQLEWSDHHEFSYNYAIWAFEEIDRLNNLNKQLVEECQRLDDEETRLNNIIDELKWKPIEEYDKSNYDWVLVKYFDGDYECVPCVAEKRFGKWYSIDEKEIQFDVKYFMDMQQLDKLKELKENNNV